jgi:hypothetical protein
MWSPGKRSLGQDAPTASRVASIRRTPCRHSAGRDISRTQVGHTRGGFMRNCRASLIVLCLTCAGPAAAQQVHAGVGYAHIFRAGGFSFATGYLQGLSGATSPLQQRVGADFWYANPDVASRATGNAARSLVGLGARYEVEVSRCCGRVHPLIALPVQVLHSSVPDQTTILASRADLLLVPVPGSPLPVEDRSGSAWGWAPAWSWVFVWRWGRSGMFRPAGRQCIRTSTPGARPTGRGRGIWGSATGSVGEGGADPRGDARSGGGARADQRCYRAGSPAQRSRLKLIRPVPVAAPPFGWGGVS